MRALLALLLLSVAHTAYAQPAAPSLLGQRPAVRLSILPIAQGWRLEGRTDYVGQVSVPVALHVPFGRSVSLTLRANGAVVEATNLEPLYGLADVQAALSYRQELGRSVAVFSLSANLPSGKTDLTVEEFATSLLLSRNVFRFQVPTFGGGFDIAPSLLLAVPLSNRFVIGLGGSYQVKGPYRPFESLGADFDPGDELLLIGGFDVRLGSATQLAADVIYTTYQRDQLGDEEVFGPGAKFVVSGQLRQALGLHEIGIRGRYRSRDRSLVPVAGLLVEEFGPSIPNQTEVTGHLRLRLGRFFATTLTGEGRLFDETRLTDRLVLYGVGLRPEVSFSRSVTMPIRLTYLFGDLQGAEAGLGLVLAL